MIRLRMSGGHLTKDKLKFIADSIKTYNVDKVHLRHVRRFSYITYSQKQFMESWKVD